MRWSYFDNIAIRNVTANTAGGLYFEDNPTVEGYHITINNLSSEGSGTGTGAAVWVEGGTTSATRYKDISINGGVLSSFTENIKITNCERVSANNVDIEDGTYAFRFTGNYNKAHAFVNPKIDSSVTNHIQLDNTDNTDGENIGVFVGEGVDTSKITDSVSSTKTRYNMLASNTKIQNLRILVGESNGVGSSTDLIIADDETATLRSIVLGGPTGTSRAFKVEGPSGEGAVSFSTTDGSMEIQTGGSARMSIDGSGNIKTNETGLTTTSTDGFFYLASTNGIPTGTPTDKASNMAMTFDYANDDLYIYNHNTNAWVKVSLT